MKALPNFKRTPQVVGVDLGQTHLLVIALQKRKGKAQLTHFRLEARPTTAEKTSELIRVIFKQEGLSTRNVRIAVKGQGTVIRTLVFPQMKKEDLEGVIRYEVDKYIPFKSDEVIFDFQILAENIPRDDAKVMEGLLVAVRQSEIYQALRFFQDANVDVECIDVNALALTNLLEFLIPDSKKATVAFLDMGADTSTFGIILKGRPIFVRDISFGGTDVLSLLKRKLNLDEGPALAALDNPAQMTMEYRTVVEQAVSNFLTELKLSLGYYLDQVPGAEPIQTLYVSGGTSRFINHDPGFIEREIKIPTQHPDILAKIEVMPRLDEALLRKNKDILPVAMGLCFR